MERTGVTSDPDEMNPQLITPGPVPRSGGNDSITVLLVFVLYSMAMFCIPFIAFFGTRYTLKNTFHIEGFPNTAWSVVAAVVTVNVIILSYACRGYVEERDDQAEEEAETNMQQKTNPNEKKTN